MSNMRKQVLKYALLPGFLPRIGNLLRSGFFNVAYLIAIIFQSVRLLPAAHPYLQPDNIGTYGLRHVLGEAANHLQFTRNNIDQIIVYVAIVSGVVLLFAQFVLLGTALLSGQTVLAQEAPQQPVFFTRDAALEHQDITFKLFDLIFGVKDIFNSCISVESVPCTDINGNIIDSAQPAQFPYPMHVALHNMLSFYAYGLFIIGVFLILYFITVIVSETAASGKPFGEQFNKTWVPVRLILFFALLTPMGSGSHAGLNSAQIITFWVAKSGSNFASNAWDRFNRSVHDHQLTGKYDLIARTKIPEFDELVQFIFIAKTCQITDDAIRGNSANHLGVEAYLVRPTQFLTGGNTTPDAILVNTAPYDVALAHAGYGSLQITFGTHITDSGHIDHDEHMRYTGGVRPVCGSMTFQTQSITQPGEAAYEIHQLYYDTITEMWNDPVMEQYATCLQQRSIQQDANAKCTDKLNKEFAIDRLEYYRINFGAAMENLIANETAENGRWNLPVQMQQQGWAGAALWYNQIAELNGEIAGAIFNLPQITKYPIAMEIVAAQKSLNEEQINQDEIFDPLIRAGEAVQFDDPANKGMAITLFKAYRFWNLEADYTGIQPSRGFFIDTINAIFGSEGIFSLRANADVNPLAQLSALGKSMMNASVRNIGVGLAGSAGAKILGGMPASLTKLGADFFGAIGWASIAISFILYYILPFMPFIYFVFAVSGWIKSIFEAIVAVPLWALAHIARRDGEGIHGPAADSGYFLLFEIFLRPILILFGLIASISIYSAMVVVLNDIYNMAVIDSIGGSANEVAIAGSIGSIAEFLRGPVDEFFFTLVYTILCYILALSSFKMIDQVPDKILRWMGQSVATFQEDNKNAAETLSGQAYSGTTLASSKFGGHALSGSQLIGVLQ